MHSLLVHRERRSRKARLGKRPYRYGDVLCLTLELVVDGGTALRAEVKCDYASFVAARTYTDEAPVICTARS